MNNVAHIRHRFSETAPDHLQLLIEILAPWGVVRSMKYHRDSRSIIAIFDKKAAEEHYQAAMAALSEGFDVEWDRAYSLKGGVMDNRRQFSRIPLTARTVVRFEDWALDSRGYDISLMGACVASDARVSFPGERCTLSVHLDRSEVVLEFEAEVVYHTPQKMGLRFLKSDIDSFIHLRHMLEFNQVDQEQLQIELGTFVEVAERTSGAGEHKRV